VLLLYCAEPLPGPYAAFEDSEADRQALVVALLLEHPSVADNHLALSLTAAQPDVGRVPCLAQDFLAFLDSGSKRQVAAGADMTWEWSRAA
jgi:hypothetical protein